MSGKKFIDLKDNDFVEYYLFPDFSSNHSSVKNNLNAIENTKKNICSIVEKLTKNYIWHNDEFKILPKNLVAYEYSDSEESEPFSFYGSLNYGENIEDEWFLVYILIELSKQIKNLVVRVTDTDGEFLLIEAAEYLPSWITPESCENRVFIYNGLLQILPKSFKPIDREYSVTDEVINYIRQNTDQTRAKDDVQKAIEKRIAKYPDRIEDNMHKTNLFVPVAVAGLLNTNPSLIAPAVRAFYERDLMDIKACQAMRFFPPENRILCNVKFTKCLYAMLATSKYLPDKRTGWCLPPPSDPAYKSHLLGIKVACGLEILVSRIRGKLSKYEDNDEINFTDDPNWKKFLQSLNKRNYFHGLLEHSKEYNQLLHNAKEFYKKSLEESIKPNRAREISELLDNLEVNLEELKEKEKTLPKSDDDDWMNITQEDLDAMLEARFGRVNQKEKDFGNENNPIADHLKTFINHISGLDGAEFPNLNKKNGDSFEKTEKLKKSKKSKTVKFSPDTKLHSSVSDQKISNEAGNKIQLDPDGFINAIQNILDFSIPDDTYWESEGSGMSSYEDESDLELGENKLAGKKDKDLIKYMQKMDEELTNTTIGKSFEKKNLLVNGENNDSFDDIENFQPVDLDKNALKNIISSYRAQLGEAGPAENLLGPLGINIDDIDADVD